MRHARTRIGGRGEGMLSDGLELFHKWSYSICGGRDETLSNSWPLQIEFLPFRPLLSLLPWRPLEIQGNPCSYQLTRPMEGMMGPVGFVFG